MSARYVVNCSILLTEHPLLERPRAAREAGFEAVEFWWPFADSVPSDGEVEAFVRAVEDAGVQLVALNFAGGDMAAGERGLVSDPARRQEFLDNVDVAVGIADRLGAKAFNALYGNRKGGVAPEAQDEVAIENLAHAAVRADTIGAAILVEPLSAVPMYPLRTAADAVAVLDRVGSPSLRLLADLYHLTVNGDDLDAVIEIYGDRIGHVQIADAPGRGAPGTGTIDFAAHLAHLARCGYLGQLSLEYVSSDEDPFRWLPPGRRGGDPWQ